ncbi:MAG: hypothetical protein LBE91_08060 [Tannerella sp.]|nr:hypothetical protein [Tannerella sp.]
MFPKLIRNKWKTGFTILLSICCCCFHTIATDRISEPPHYKIRRISPARGLGMNGQRDVRQDRWNFIWVITVHDLYRVDAYTFKDIRKNYFLRNMTVHSIVWKLIEPEIFTWLRIQIY